MRAQIVRRGKTTVITVITVITPRSEPVSSRFSGAPGDSAGDGAPPPPSWALSPAGTRPEQRFCVCGDSDDGGDSDFATSDNVTSADQ